MKPPGYLSRPLGVASFFCALLLAGAFCLPLLGVGILPPLPLPKLTVTTNYENATPFEVDALVTRRLEAVLGTVTGLARIESRSIEGASQVSLIFDWQRNLKDAASEVREKLDSAADQLPKEADPPLVSEVDPNAAPALILAVSGSGGGLALRELAEARIKNQLETLQGVAEVKLFGGLAPEIEVLADRGRLVAYGLDLKELVEAARQANLNTPAGEISLGGKVVPVRTVGRYTSLRDIGMTPVAAAGRGSVASLNEVARVRRGFMDRTGFSRFMAKPVVLARVYISPDANAVMVSDRVRERLMGIKRGLPAGVEVKVADDQAPFIRHSLSGLAMMAGWGALLAFLVLALFERSLVRALLVLVSIPPALAVTFCLMHLFGVGLNLMSIGGLALGVGMLLDGSIVILEAYGRRRAEENRPAQAAALALYEVRGGLVVGALTIGVVLVPVFFLAGLTQKLFMDFAFTLAASLASSLATAIFLTPCLAVWLDRLIRVKSGRTGGSPFAARYGRALSFLLRRRYLIIIPALAAAGVAAYIFAGMGASLLPDSGQRRLTASLVFPHSTSLAAMERIAGRAEAEILKDSRVESILMWGGADPKEPDGQGLARRMASSVRMVIRLKPGLDDAAVNQAASRAMQRLDSLGGMQASVRRSGQGLGTASSRGEAPQLVILSGDDLEGLRPLALEAKRLVALVPGMESLSLAGAEQAPELDVVVDRQTTALRGVSVGQVARTVRRALKGEKAGELIEGDTRTDIRIRLDKGRAQGLAGLDGLPLKAADGGMVFLGRAAVIARKMGPLEILRYDRRPSVVIRGAVKGQAFSRTQEQALAALAALGKDGGVTIRKGVDAAEMETSLKNLAAALGLALFLVYVILIVRFESLTLPLVILLSLPPLALGPALVLKALNLPLSAPVLLGSVVLLGMAVNASVLFVDLASRKKALPAGTGDSLVTAARIRLRPLGLSILTTVLGALPLCLGLGGGSEIARPLALTATSGLLAAFFVTAFVTPLLYSLLSRKSPPKGGPK